MDTVRRVAGLAGVTPRTLHHDDAIGLLKPTAVAPNGYRQYGDEALLLLRQILVYWELGLGLARIRRLLGKPDFSVVKALEVHRRALSGRIERLNRPAAGGVHPRVCRSSVQFLKRTGWKAR